MQVNFDLCICEQTKEKGWWTPEECVCVHHGTIGLPFGFTGFLCGKTFLDFVEECVSNSGVVPSAPQEGGLARSARTRLYCALTLAADRRMIPIDSDDKLWFDGRHILVEGFQSQRVCTRDIHYTFCRLLPAASLKREANKAAPSSASAAGAAAAGEGAEGGGGGGLP